LRHRIAVTAVVSSMAVTAIIIAILAITIRETRASVPPGTVHYGTFSRSAGTVEIFGDVRGDVVSRSWYYSQLGRVAGDLSASAGFIELRGFVAGKATLRGGVISIYGEIDGDVEACGLQIRLIEGAQIHGNLIVHAGDLQLLGNARVDGDLRGQSASVSIEGTVGGDVVPVARTVALASGSIVEGNLSYESQRLARVDAAATVHGRIERRNPADRLPWGELWLWHSSAVPRALVSLLAGLLVLLILPRQLTRAADTIVSDLYHAFLAGTGVSILVPMLLITLGALVVTIPLAVLGLLAFGALAYLSLPVVGLALGRALFQKLRRSRSRRSGLVPLSVGVPIIVGLRVLPIPWIDPAIAVVTAVTGIGAIAIQLWFGTTQRDLLARRRRISFGLGIVLAAFAVVTSVAAILLSLGSAAMAIATTSRSAVFTWEITPGRLGAIALALAATGSAAGGVLIRETRHSLELSADD
jgi:cytoskeletal protein CcmA (bactofilin family)